MQAIQRGSLWTIINDVVYDLTDYIQEHPGGVKVMEDIVGEIDFSIDLWISISQLCSGVDGTDAFLESHADDRTVMKVLASLAVGELHDETGIVHELNQVTNTAASTETILMIITFFLRDEDPSLPVTSKEIWLNLKTTVAAKGKHRSIQRRVHVVGDDEVSPPPSSTHQLESAEIEVCLLALAAVS